MIRGAAAALCAVFALSSCASVETRVNTISLGTSATVAITQYEVRNEQVGGLVLGSSSSGPVTAAPMPSPVIAEPDTAVFAENDAVNEPEEQPPEDTTAAVTTQAVQTTSAQTAAVTTAAATTTTTAAATTAETTTTAAATTTPPPETTTTTAAQAAVMPSSGNYGRNSYSALNHSYVKAVWISYIEIAENLAYKTESQFKTAFGAMLDNCKSLGINTVYVHVRSHGDAYFYSGLFPFTRQLTGTPDKRTDYDPLKVMVSEAHDRGISFHAWINPLRLCGNAEMAGISPKYPVGKWYNGSEKGTYIVNVNGTWFLNPAYEAVRKLVGDNVREIVSNYNVDGIHIDDYFYPTTDKTFDSAAFAASGSSSLASWRIANINAMVKEIYTATHECGSAVFGAAPQGSDPNNLGQLYADTEAWCKGGYVDYFAPQIYYGFSNQLMPYKTVVDHWLAKVSGTSTKLIVGLAVYKCGNEDKWAGTGKTEWQGTTDMLRRQIEYANSKGCSGAALYSYDYVFATSKHTSAMQTEINNIKPLLAG